MLRRLSRFAAPCAAMALAACAGSGEALRRDVGALQAEVTALRQENAALARRVDALAAKVEAAPAQAPRAALQSSQPVIESEPLVPPDLAVVRVAPPRTPRAPPVATAVQITEPDSDRLEALAQPAGREIGAEADGELAAARRKAGVERARSLERFVARYPRHPSADNALVEAARDYADAGRSESGCELAARVPQDYPAGDAVSAANEIVARCERSRP